MAFLSNHYSQKKKSGRSIWLYLVNSSYIEHVFGLVNPGAIVHVLRLLLQLRTRPPLAVARVTWWLTGANSKGAPSQWRYAMTTTVRDVGSQQNQLNSAGNAQRMVVTWPSQVTAAMLKTPLQCNFFLFFSCSSLPTILHRNYFHHYLQMTHNRASIFPQQTAAFSGIGWSVEWVKTTVSKGGNYCHVWLKTGFRPQRQRAPSTNKWTKWNKEPHKRNQKQSISKRKLVVARSLRPLPWRWLKPGVARSAVSTSMGRRHRHR